MVRARSLFDLRRGLRELAGGAHGRRTNHPAAVFGTTFTSLYRKAEYLHRNFIHEH